MLCARERRGFHDIQLVHLKCCFSSHLATDAAKIIFAGLEIRISEAPGFNLWMKRSSIFLSSPCLPHALQHTSGHLACCFGNSDKEVSSVFFLTISSPEENDDLATFQVSERKIG